MGGISPMVFLGQNSVPLTVTCPHLIWAPTLGPTPALLFASNSNSGSNTYSDSGSNLPSYSQDRVLSEPDYQPDDK